MEVARESVTSAMRVLVDGLVRAPLGVILPQ